MSGTETVIGDVGTGCVEPVSGGVTSEGVPCGIDSGTQIVTREGFGGLR